MGWFQLFFGEAVEVFVAAQEELFADGDGAGVELFVEGVGGEDLEFVGVFDDGSDSVAAWQVDAAIRRDR